MTATSTYAILRRLPAVIFAALVLCVVTPAQSNPPRDESAVLQGPERLILGVDGPARLSIRSPEHESPAIFTNTGTLSDLGEDSVTYTPPGTAFPQVAIVAIVGASGSAAWISFPLYGRPRVTVDSEANADVHLVVDGVEHGPYRTDRRGRARVRIPVPPGVETGITRARDGAGNLEEAVLSLDPPPFNRVLAVCPGDRGKVVVFVVDERGAPDADAELELTSETGQVSGATAVSPGVYEATLTVAPGRDAEFVEVRASIPDEPASSSTCPAKVPARPRAVVASLARKSSPPIGIAGPRLALDASPSRPAPGPRSTRTVYARLGYLTNFAKVSAPQITLGVSLALSALDERVSVGAEVGWFQSETTAARDDGTERVEVSVRGVPILARASYELALGDGAAYGSGGLGVMFSSTELSSPRSGTLSVAEPTVAWSAAAGGRYRVGWGFGLLEVGYLHAAASEKTGGGGVGGLSVSGGYAVGF